MTGFPGIGDRGAGPFISATLGVPAGRPGRRWLIGAGYGIVFTKGWTSPDGVNYPFAPEGVIGALGREWAFGGRERVALDVQWNPSIARVRSWGPDPGWPRESSPWRVALPVASVGLRLTPSTTKGPVVSVTGRAYVHLHPYAIMYGALGIIRPAIGVTIRRR